MAYGNQQQQQREYNILDARYSSMSAPSTQEGKWASWKWGINKGEITITVFTNDEKDSSTFPNDKGRIAAKLSPRQFGWFTAALKNALASTGPYDAAYTHEDFKFFGQNKRSDTRLPIWTLLVRRLEDGKIVVMLMDADSNKSGRPRIPFNFAPPIGAKLKTSGGVEMNEAQVSQLFAQGFLDTTVPLIMELSNRLYEHRMPKQQNNQGGYNNNQGGYNRGNQNQGGYQQGGNYGGGNAPSSSQGGGSTDYDNDIPF